MVNQTHRENLVRKTFVVNQSHLMKSVQLVQKVVQVWNWKQLRKQFWQNWKEYTRVFRDSDSRGHKWCFTVLSGHLYRFLPPWNHKMPANVGHHREESQPRTLTPKKAASKPPPLTSNTATTGCSRHDRPLYYHFRWLTLALPHLPPQTMNRIVVQR